ncbi:ankyrin repeat domain-containing protein [Flagellimonas aequoris]|uniref:Ankyrin repeat domain-containing protein n=1 Tax=Flagellimonas aequoris TaxID=2306997 RepID=A0A418N4H3_9FLAO|nr:ankyrin repeat domain-containing protein [Allomuricauda aequoris]RIV68752.1 ankyrin repeat domain-containing protein [Allomuricauda aequoris]TXK00451.1 ankyrin repeat domain-containing protein [Allomuricauda aequoris]
MIANLKEFIKNKETDKILNLIKETPEVLGQQDESGTSGLLMIAYSGMPDVFETAKTLKKTFAFHEAIVCGKVERVKELLHNTPSFINQYSNDGFTPVSLAAFFDQIEIAKWLLEQGADPNLHATNPSKVNALHAAVAKENVELCQLLIAKGADINAPQMQNVTALHSAAHRGNLELVKLLVQQGADIDLKMDNGDTALSIVKRDGHKEVAAYLEER